MRHCPECQIINLQTTNYASFHLEVPLVLSDLISMDLKGPLEITTRGNQYTLTVICMLINYVMCIPLADKPANTVCKWMLIEVYCRFRGSQKMLSDSGSEIQELLVS